MAALTLTDFPRRSPLGIMLSIILHGAVVGGLLYASFNQQHPLPVASQPFSVSMVAPDLQPESAPRRLAQPEPNPQAESVPESPKTQSMPIPEPTPKAQSKSVRKKWVTQKKTIHPRQPPPQANPFKQDTAQSTKPASAQKVPAATTQTAPSTPSALITGKPVYPPRAQALHIEGRVRVQFNVSNNGKVGDIQILSAQPQNMFERSVKEAVRKWRYQPGKPGNLTVTIIFKMNGGASLE